MAEQREGVPSAVELWQKAVREGRDYPCKYWGIAACEYRGSFGCDCLGIREYRELAAQTSITGATMSAELVERAKRYRRDNLRETSVGYALIGEMADHIDGLLAERERLNALISEAHIEYLAKDIAIACVDCLPEIREARHRAMVRLGERLRNPLSTDTKRILAQPPSAKEGQ